MKITKQFKDKDGKLSRSPSKDAIELVITVGDKEHAIKPDDLTEEMRYCAMLHGMSQKFGDAASGWAKAGLDPFAMIGAVVGQVKDDGIWNRIREGVGGHQSSIVVEAMAAVLGVELADAQEKYDGLPEDKQKALRKHPQVAVEIANIQAKRKAEAAKAAAAAAKDSSALDLDKL